ncbi:MAG: hypothetical protein A2231_07020 [Candidatus Firestonebacteria bacterium RIFOXYA2_FULL_40_8]|nr:MAG: hypothetical protein A2231_07020 [Candidatus Firestonebacteria bacterium RIFOXYA2_FULL_40_8]
MKSVKTKVFSGLLVFGLILLFSGVANAKDFMFILKFDKGEMFNDFDPSKVEMGLAKEHMAKGAKVSMKLMFKTKCGIGELHPGRAAWGEFTKMTFTVYNDSKEERKMKVIVKGAKEPANGDTNRMDYVCKLPPGESVQTIDLTKEKCKDGTSTLDLSKIYLYAFSNPDEEPLTVYISDLKLVK